ncbi:MAG: hypothetical protein EOO28_11865 [Comamonadaceae bacterium]|nr:MAG: hypothetical protein EOO28_11865 [Comamonadaceae bacterium]
MAEKLDGLVPCVDAGLASAESGFVILDGPDGVAVSMTPAAARLTADSLVQAAEQAERQETSASND